MKYLLLPFLLWQLAILVASVLVGTKHPRHGAIFFLLQTCSMVLTAIGWILCPVLSLLAASRFIPATKQWHWPRIFWLYDNDQEGTCPDWYLKANPTWSFAMCEMIWTGFRNSVHNLALVPGVSGTGRPLWYRAFTLFGRPYYAKAGWLSNGYPCMSAGAGRGY